MTRVGVSCTIPKQSIRAPNGLRTFSTTEEIALPKIKSEDDAEKVFLRAKALCIKSSCKKVALLMQNIIKVC